MGSHEINAQGCKNSTEEVGYGLLLELRKWSPKDILMYTIIVHLRKTIQKHFFSLNSELKLKDLALRICFDDKAYLKCGTSEGFSRPSHRPVQLTDTELQFQLPTSNYPESCGYITPGVILLAGM